MNQNTLTIPAQGAEIQEVNGVMYLVARLEETRTCEWYISELKKGNPVVVPQSKRGRLVGLLKAKGIFTKSKTLVTGKWISFVPCEQREFKDFYFMAKPKSKPSILGGKTEGGSGGGRGHSNMNHHIKTEEIKNAAKKARRFNDKKIVDQQLAEH